VGKNDPLFAIDTFDLENQLLQIASARASAQAQAEAQAGAIEQARVYYDHTLAALEKAQALLTPASPRKTRSTTRSTPAIRRRPPWNRRS
jgi:multidrug resistance efflux pump